MMSGLRDFWPSPYCHLTSIWRSSVFVFQAKGRENTQANLLVSANSGLCSLMCVHMCVHCAYVHMHAGTYDARPVSHYLFQSFVCNRVFHRLGSLIRLGWLTSRPRDPPDSTCPTTEITSTHHMSGFFTHVLDWGLNSKCFTNYSPRSPLRCCCWILH